MPFSMSFTAPEVLTHRSNDMNDDSPTSAYSVILDVCDQVEEAGCTFAVEGFGLRWVTKFGGHLGTVVPDFLSTIDALANDRSAELHFAEQGLQRIIHLRRRDDLVDMTVESATYPGGPTIDPDPATETIPLADLTAMMTTICRQVAEAITVVNPTLAALRPIPDWRQGNTTLATVEPDG